MADHNSSITELKDILDYVPDGELVVSVNLMVDGSRVTKKDYLTRLNSMLNETKGKLESDYNLNKKNKKKVGDILEKIKEYVVREFKPYSARTLVIYASPNGLWRVFRAPIIMGSKIIIDPKPHTQNIRALLQNYKRYAILLIDREKAQIYSMYLGEIKEYIAAFISDVPSRVNFRSQSAFREKKILGRIEEKLHHFFKIINDKIIELFRNGKFDYLILGGRNEIISKFKEYMHSYLKSKYVGTIEAEPDYSESLVKERANKIIYEFEKKYKDELIDKLLDEYNPRGWGVAGIEATINSLLIEQIRALLFDIKFIKEGYICNSCRYMTVKIKDKCPYCNGKLVFYNDIVDEIVEDSLNQGCEVFEVEDNKKLQEAGNIGAILRYKL